MLHIHQTIRPVPKAPLPRDSQQLQDSPLCNPLGSNQHSHNNHSTRMVPMILIMYNTVYTGSCIDLKKEPTLLNSVAARLPPLANSNRELTN
jgi:hypothetical protein